MKEEIGGYFELWAEKRKEYHGKAFGLNSGRNAFAYILHQKKPRKIFIPYYCCNALLEPLRALKVDYEFYPINQLFEPIFAKPLCPNEYFLYINYFGVCTAVVRRMVSRLGNKVIVDNSQAFFALPMKSINTFYSPRKFFGVADGGYLYTDDDTMQPLPQDVSYQRYLYLLKRLDTTASEAYRLFMENEAQIAALPMARMSKITRAILASIDYGSVEKRRVENFQFLHGKLKELNELSLNMNTVTGPHSYPLLSGIPGIREYLISKKIYVPTYWREVMERNDLPSNEYHLARNLIALPVDQRYGKAEMNRICDCVNRYMHNYQMSNRSL